MDEAQIRSVIGCSWNRLDSDLREALAWIQAHPSGTWTGFEQAPSQNSSEIQLFPDKSDRLDFIRINLVTVGGQFLALDPVSSSMLGIDLVQTVGRQHPPGRNCYVKLLFGDCVLEGGRTLSEQALDDNAEITYLTRYVSEDEQSILEKAVRQGQELHGEEAMMWNAIDELLFCRDLSEMSSFDWPAKLTKVTIQHDVILQKHGLPETLRSLTFEPPSLQEELALPSSLQTLTFGDDFNQSLEKVALPSSLQALTFGSSFNQSLEKVALPSSLQTLTFAKHHNQSRLENVVLPRGCIIRLA